MIVEMVLEKLVGSPRRGEIALPGWRWMGLMLMATFFYFYERYDEIDEINEIGRTCLLLPA